MIHPDSLPVHSPRSVSVARCTANLAHQRDTLRRSGRAVVAVTVVGRALHGAPIAAVVTLVIVPVRAISGAGCEISSAAAVYPHAVIVIAPGFVEPAWASTHLIDEPDTPARIDAAVVPPFIVRVATDALLIEAAAIMTAIIVIPAGIAGAKFSPASPVYPHSALIETPRPAFDARGTANLAAQTDTARGVDIAIVPSAVIGRTADVLLCGQELNGTKNGDENKTLAHAFLQLGKKNPGADLHAPGVPNRTEKTETYIFFAAISLIIFWCSCSVGRVFVANALISLSLPLEDSFWNAAMSFL